MVMNAMRKGAAGGVLKFFLFGLLALAAGGLVFTDVGGFFRGGGVSRSDVVKIGNQTVSIQQFDSMARRTLRNYGMTPQQAYQAGYMTEMLNGEIRTRLLSQKAEDVGIYVGTPVIADKVNTLLAPLSQPGQPPHEVLAQVLAAQGMTERAFSESIRREMEVEQLGKAVAAGFARVSDTMIADLARYEKEARSVEYIPFMISDFSSDEAVSDDQLLKMYEGTKEAYAIPETRKAQLIIIKPSDATLDVSDEEALVVYNRNIEAYTQTAGRTVEQVILADAEKAKAVADSAMNGKPLKDAVQAVTGNTADYIPAQKVTLETLPEPLKAPVFEAKIGDVIGPVTTPLGHQVMALVSIDEEKVQSFDSVKKAIKDELSETKTLDSQYDLANTVDDMLASGADAEEIKTVADIEVIDLPTINAMGSAGDDKSGLAAYGDDAPKLLQAIFELNEGESSPVFELADGRIAAVVLQEITPKSYQNYDDVKERIAEQWKRDAQKTGNSLAVMTILTEAQTDGLSLKDIGQKYKKQIRRADNIIRTKAPEAPLTMASLMNIFEAGKDELFTVDIEGGTALARVTNINIDDAFTAEERQSAEPNIIKSFQNESYGIFLEAQRKDFGVDVNNQILDQLYGATEETSY